MAYLRHLLGAALGSDKADMVIRGAKVCNVFSFEYETTDVAVSDGFIVGVGSGYEGRTEIDAAGKVLFPGLIDGHVHIESSGMTPTGFVEAVLPHGTTAIMADPHEIANVAGLVGVRDMKKACEGLPLDVYLAAPSCVPASQFESCCKPMLAADIEALLADGTCHHLGEVMDFPSVIGGGEEVWKKIRVAAKYVRTAHAPGVTGKDLCAYMLSACDGDHESRAYKEGLEKLRRGMWLMIRQGSSGQNMNALLPILLENPARAAHCMVVSDDLTAGAIAANGHMDTKMRMMTKAGLDPLIALRLMTLSPAEYFKLDRVGAIAPGWRADMVLADSLENCCVEKVWKDGALVVDGGRLLSRLGRYDFHELPRPVLRPLTPDDIAVKAQRGRLIRVIGDALSLVTRELQMEPTVRDGAVVADPSRDICKMVVRERHGGSGGIGIGFLRGVGLKRGALAASVAHDGHNFSAAGADDTSILTALEWLRVNGGGVVVADGEKIVESFALPVAGLMSDEPAEKVADGVLRLQSAARSIGVGGDYPCMALSFLSLSVIPEIKLTDKGYIEITNGGIKELFV